jgi:hypothetical protein
MGGDNYSEVKQSQRLARLKSSASRWPATA